MFAGSPSVGGSRASTKVDKFDRTLLCAVIGPQFGLSMKQVAGRILCDDTRRTVVVTDTLLSGQLKSIYKEFTEPCPRTWPGLACQRS